VRGKEERGMGRGGRRLFERLGGAEQRGKRGGDVGTSAWRREKEERGGGAGTVVSSAGRPIVA
jgi:hypothetical protein